jgi:hypothetical protein
MLDYLSEMKLASESGYANRLGSGVSPIIKRDDHEWVDRAVTVGCIL